MDAAIGSGPAARPAETAAEREAAAEALALAFTDDPCWEHLLPDDRRRPEQLLAYFSSEIEALTPDWRELWVTEDGAGAALWAPPGRWRVPVGVTAGEARRMMSVFGRRLPLGLWTQLRLERHHPSSPNHWYLHYLGVEPRLQGKGLGSALMAPVLERCDAEGVPAHLESSSERSRALYERNGFALTEVFPMPPKGPPVREMWRDPGGGE